MLTRCPTCGTRFDFDDSRVPKRGARVRCTRCENSFFVSAPWMRRGRAILASGVGWLLFFPLIAFATVANFSGVPEALMPQPQSVSVAGLEVIGLRADRVENRHDGWILLVSGRLRNASADSLVTRSTIRVNLVDFQGQPISGVSALAGDALERASLFEQKTEVLRDILDSRARKLAWTRIGPGEEREFQALFPNIPQEVARASLEAVSAAAPAVGGD